MEDDRVWTLIESKTLVNGAKWEDAQSTVKALTFGKMVELARDRVSYYTSDLYHDAIWLQALTGSTSFDWVVRESGTYIGDITRHVKDDAWEKSARYRLDIRLDGDRKWVLDIHEAGPIVNVIPHFCEECGLQPSQYVDYMQMWLCSDVCTGKTENRQSIGCPDCGETGRVLSGTECANCDHVFPELEKEDLGAKYRDKMFEEIVIPDDFVWPDALLPYLSNGPLPEKAVEAVAKMDVNPIDAMADLLLNKATGNPTLGNESKRKENKMDAVREMLEEKLSDLQNKLEELDDAEREVEDAKEIAQRNIDSIEEAINSLDLELEDFYLSIDVSFNE